MSPERLKDYSSRFTNWQDLVKLGGPIWDNDALAPTSKERQEITLAKMRSLIGQPSLEVIRHFAKEFSEFTDIAAIGGCFYYYHREPEEDMGEQKEAAVMVPLETALDSRLFSQDWINSQRERLAKEWGVETVSFGIIGNVYSQFEWESCAALGLNRGEINEHWHGSLRFIDASQRFMVFIDIDRKVDNQTFLSASRQIGTPFIIAESTRGHHLFLPIIFDRGFNNDLVGQVYKTIGLVRGVPLDQRYLWRSLEKRTPTIRTTSGLNRIQVPTVSGVVWDENNLFRA